MRNTQAKPIWLVSSTEQENFIQHKYVSYFKISEACIILQTLSLTHGQRISSAGGVHIIVKVQADKETPK